MKEVMLLWVIEVISVMASGQTAMYLNPDLSLEMTNQPEGLTKHIVI